jgi:Glycosyl transferase 4-like domain
MKKVLFIAYLYPPIFNSGTRRSLDFVNKLPDNGWAPIVLTVNEPDAEWCDAELMREVRLGTRIERVPLWSDWFSKKIAHLFAHLFNEKRIADGIAWRIRSLWTVPDECAFWKSMAVRRAEKIYIEEGFDAIYATGWPWTSFLIAAELSRRTGCPYVLDYRDFWKSAGAQWDRPTFLQRWINPWLEKKTIRNASALISVTPGFVDVLSQTPGSATQWVCISNGFNPEDFMNVSLPSKNPGPSVTIVYTGVWRAGYGPEDLYLAVQYLKEKNSGCLDRLKVIVAGYPAGKAGNYGVTSHFEELGTVSHAQSIRLMMHSSALYLPVSSGLYEKTSLPGKLFDYLGSGRPILASAPFDSEVAFTLGRVGGAHCVQPGDHVELASAIERLCIEGEPQVFSVRIQSEVDVYHRANLTRKLSAVLDSVSVGRGLGLCKKMP